MNRQHRARDPKTPPQPGWGPRSHQPPPPQQSTAWPNAAQSASSPGQPPGQAPTAPPPRKRRRVFFWVFLAVQILFLIWVITGAASGSGTPEDCKGLTGDQLELCNDASDVGTTIGVGLIIGLWVAADFILGLTYLVYRLATRQPRA